MISGILLCMQSAQDSRFPGRGRTLGSGQGQIASAVHSDSNLQARLLDNSSPDHPVDSSTLNSVQQVSSGRYEKQLFG